MLKKLTAIFLCLLIAVSVSVPALAAEFTPSVTAKPAPAIVPIIGTDGKEYAGAICDANGNVIKYVPFDAIIVTSIANAGDSRDVIKNRIIMAYEMLGNAGNLGSLSDELDDAIKEISSSISVNDIVVRDLFDIFLTDEYASLLTNGNYLEITFNLDTDAMLLAAVLHFLGGENWEAVMGDYLIRDGKTITLRLTSLGPFAFLFDAGKLDVAPNAPSSPQTNDISTTFSTVAVIAMAALLVFATSIVVIRRKRSK